MEKKITAIMIDLKSNKEPLLFLLLHADGTINRMGIGNHSADPFDQHLFIGIMQDTPFNEVVALVTDDIIRLMGDSHQMSVIEGERCLLTLSLLFDTGETTAMQLAYGSESNEVPSDLVNLVATAVRLTDPWHTKHKENAGRSGNPVPRMQGGLNI